MSDDIAKGITDPQIQKLYAALKVFDADVIQSVLDLTNLLDSCALRFSTDPKYRNEVGEVNPTLWNVLSILWDTTVQAHHNSPDDHETRLSGLCRSLAKFTRNLVAAEPLNQERALKNEPVIRSMIHRYTSYSAMQDETTFPVTRMLAQTLSNLITANETLSKNLWSEYLKLPEEQLILLRLFLSPDTKTVISAFVLILNCIHDSRERIAFLISSPRGPRLCISLLDRLSSLADSEDSSDSNQAFTIGYEIFSKIIYEGLAPRLYAKIAVDEEIITPHQTTLLKLLDSYLQSTQHPELLFAEPESSAELVQMLLSVFLSLTAYAQQAIRRALGISLTTGSSVPRSTPDDSPYHTFKSSGADAGNQQSSEPTQEPLQQLDLLLPKVCEALVLVSQCLITMLLNAEEGASDISNEISMKESISTATSRDGQGLVESLVETLRLLDSFIPRITFGKVVRRTAPSGLNEDENPIQNEKAPSTDTPSSPGFNYVKRDLTRLLGIVASGNKAVQDRVRACGGIPVIMNLCVVDDQNPYLREHAIFTLRNLLYRNQENQDVVNDIRPMGRWDPSGVLRPV